MNYITYLAHSDPGYINECRFSLLKYLSVYNLQPPPDTGIIIYTDQPQMFEQFIPFFRDFTIETINATKLAAWQEGSKYVHRSKPRMIQEIFTRKNGNLLFFDTDTYITGPIEQLWKSIGNGQIIMHESEGVIDQEKNPDFHKWDEFLKTATLTYRGKQFSYSKFFEVWNTGVLGLSSVNAPVIEDIIALIDSMYNQFPKHIAEQVACSYCFRQKATITAANKLVIHYWNLKEFRRLLELFFVKNQEESIPNLIKLVHYLDAYEMQQEKNRYKQLPLLQRLIKNLSGKSWKIEQYEKKI